MRARSHTEPGPRERLILGLLLAFLLTTVRPSFQVTAHLHAGGERPHVHAGDVRSQSVAGTRQAFHEVAERAPAPSGRRLEQASTTGLHHHFTLQLHHARLATFAVVERVSWSTRLVGEVVPSVPDGTAIAGQARAPPSLSA